MSSGPTIVLARPQAAAAGRMTRFVVVALALVGGLVVAATVVASLTTPLADAETEWFQ